MARVLVTGGCGFIGSHQVVELVQSGHDVVVVDNLSNSYEAALDAVERIVGTKPEFHKIDVRETDKLADLISARRLDTVIHFAGMKHVGESTFLPRQYYDCNVGGLLSLLEACEASGLRQMVFSSSGSIYGNTDKLPIPETCQPRPTNPYSNSKVICENILADLCAADSSWRVVALRYFNPAGAHSSGALGEFCPGPPSNIVPALVNTALSNHPAITIHGDDFGTVDGTGVRDYVHVMDVANAHLQAIQLLNGKPEGATGFEALNIGRGEGVSVLQLVRAMEQASEKTIDVRIGPRRPGDVASLYGDTTLAARRFGKTSYRDLNAICQDAWAFRRQNPNGYLV